MEFLRQIGIIQRDITPLDPEAVFYIGNYPIANSTLLAIFIAILLLLFGVFVVRRFALRPGKTQTVVEALYEQVVGLIDQITGSRKHAERIFHIVGAMLVYLTVANLIALIPGLEQITFNDVSVFRSPTADFNTTFALAFGSVLVINIISIREYGILGYLGKFFKFKEIYQGFKKGISDGFVGMIDFFVGLLDIIGEIAKIVSLALRLFGNMYAGSVLMIILFGAFALVVPSLWLAMNIFVGILQAMVFASLVAAYYMLAVKTDDEPASEEGNTAPSGQLSEVSHE